MRYTRILFFASARDFAGVKSYDLPMEDFISVREIKILLANQFPGLVGTIDVMLVAVNQSFVQLEELVEPGSEVAIFPPVSGGSGELTCCSITSAILSLDDITREITTQETGAVAVFTGIVREITKSESGIEKTVGLEYEAYTEMAEQKMYQIAQEIRAQWGEIIGIAIVQRVGYQAAGEVSVVIACSAAHRDTGVFEAARYGIDRLKEIVPVWKKEIRPDGSTWVEGSYLPGDGD